MNARERAAYNAGIEAVRQAAMIAAVSIEVGADGCNTWHRAAAAALHDFTDRARSLMLDTRAEAATGPAMLALDGQRRPARSDLSSRIPGRTPRQAAVISRPTLMRSPIA